MYLHLHFRHDGLIILATNRPYDLDEAMHRRIMIAIEFGQPDHLLRKAIWESHMPEQMKLADDIELVSWIPHHCLNIEPCTNIVLINYVLLCDVVIIDINFDVEYLLVLCYMSHSTEYVYICIPCMLITRKDLFLT